MRSRSWLDTLAAAAAALMALALFPRPAAADHSVGQSCYVCHNLKSSSIYKGTRAIDKTKAIGLNPAAAVTQPLNCEFCHTSYTSEFNASAKSNHPVKHINGSAFYVNAGGAYQVETAYNGVKLICKDCHGGDTLSGTPTPDVAPVSYDAPGKASTADGYPNHHLNGSTNGVVTPFKPAWDTTPAAGDMPHTTSAYNHKASTTPATDYALCFSCHNGDVSKTTNHVNVSLEYSQTGGGHYFTSDGARIACNDCHDTHGSAASIKLYNRNFSGPITTDANHRLICLDCHTGTSRSFTDTTAGSTRSVTVPLPPPNVAAHNSGTSACTLCHDPHNPAGGRTNCFNCHSTSTPQSPWKDALGGTFTKYVDDGAGDDFAWATTYPSKHNVTFTNVASANCLDCHVITAGKHGNGSTNDDLKYNGPNGANWPVSSATETGNTFGSGIEFCLGCHRGGTNYWSQTPPAMNTFVDFGPDGTSGGGDNVTNFYGQGDTTVTGYTSNAPTIYDSATGTGHDPPSGYTGVPMFAHYTQGATNNTTPKWWQLGSASAPQPLPCMDCHYAHGAPNEALYRSPRNTQNRRSEKGTHATPREICLDCHNSAASLEGRTPDDPTSPQINSRYDEVLPAHNAASTTLSCSSSATQCHNPHSPSCEVCHAYPP